MEILSEEETSLYSPRLMFESSTSHAWKMTEQRELGSCDGWDELYQKILTMERKPILESENSVIQECYPEYVDPIRGTQHDPKKLKGSTTAYQQTEEVLTRKAVKAFVRTFPHNFNPETADLQKVMGNKTINAPSGFWKLTTFLFGSHITQSLRGACQLALPDEKGEKYCYEVDYELPNAEESWSLLLTFARQAD